MRPSHATSAVGVGRDAQKLEEVKKVVGDPARVETIAVDLTDDDAPKRIVDATLARWPRIDFLVNNAGIGSPRPLHETDDQTLSEMFLCLPACTAKTDCRSGYECSGVSGGVGKVCKPKS